MSRFLILEVIPVNVVSFRFAKSVYSELGRRQTASQEILDLPIGGSSPPAPVTVEKSDGRRTVL